MYLKQLNRPSADFEMIPRVVTRMGLTAEAIGLLVIVACHHGDEIRACQMSERMNCGKKKRQRVLRELRDKGLLTIEKRRTERGSFTTGYVFDWDAVAKTRPSENLPNTSSEVLEKPEPANPASVLQTPEPENPASVPQTPEPPNGSPALRTPEPPNGSPGPLRSPTGGPKGALSLKQSDDDAAASQRAASSPRKSSPEFVNEFLSGRRNLLRKRILPTDPPKGLR